MPLPRAPRETRTFAPRGGRGVEDVNLGGHGAPTGRAAGQAGFGTIIAPGLSERRVVDRQASGGDT